MQDDSIWDGRLIEALNRHDDERFINFLDPAMASAGFNIDRRVQYGRTLLAIACRNGATRCARVLLEKGADPNITNYNGTSPLMYAKTAVFASGDLSLLEVLLSYGARVQHTDKYGKNAAQYTKERADLILSFFESKGLIASEA